jgi:hypothetical protein
VQPVGAAIESAVAAPRAFVDPSQADKPHSGEEEQYAFDAYQNSQSHPFGSGMSLLAARGHSQSIFNLRGNKEIDLQSHRLEIAVENNHTLSDDAQIDRHL